MRDKGLVSGAEEAGLCLGVITGVHRSGTTILGQFARIHRGVSVLHEPFNPRYGDRDVKRVFPAARLRSQEGVIGLMESALDGRVNPRRYVSGDTIFRGVLRLVSGGRLGVDLWGFRWRKAMKRDQRIIIKDPFLLFLTELLLERRIKVIVAVRHPAATWLSVKRMGWKFSFRDALNEEILEEYKMPSAEYLDSKCTELERFAHLWKLAHVYIGELVGHPGLALFKHEDLCVEPERVLRNLQRFLGISCSEGEFSGFIESHFHSEEVEKQGAVLHQMKRNSRMLVDAWRDKMAPWEMDSIQAICGAEIEVLYGDRSGSLGAD